MEKLHRIFNRARIDDRQVNELLGMCHGLIADGKIDQSEAEYLHKWLVANSAAHENPVVRTLLQRVSDALGDGVLGEDEGNDLFDTLKNFAAGDFELGELQKSTSLPLDHPPPPITFAGQAFCFTGTFAFGSRRECEAAVVERGAHAGALSQSTSYLIVGIYATDSWAHSSYGRKIEKAVAMQEKFLPIHIFGEADWVESL